MLLISTDKPMSSDLQTAAAGQLEAEAACPSSSSSGSGSAAAVEVEKDSDAPESMDLHSLLLPAPGQLPTQHHSFALAYNSALLNAWVKQSSPACAAGALSFGDLEPKKKKKPVAMLS